MKETSAKSPRYIPVSFVWDLAGAGTAPSPFLRLVSAMAPPVRHVGVVGGGIAGLSCASRLQELGLAVTLYDTGKRGPGGRASSRLWRSQVADHAAQFAEARTELFQQHMDELMHEGKVRRLASGALCNLVAPGVVEPLADDVPRFVGVGGMGAIADAAVGYLDDVRRDVWVSPNNGIRQGGNGQWLVRESKSVERPFDAIVIAHNGKCAERLTSRVAARTTHMLLRTRFAAKVGGGGGGGGRMTLNSMYSLLFEVWPCPHAHAHAHAPCTMHHALCTMRHAPCTMRHAPCTMRHAPCTTHSACTTMHTRDAHEQHGRAPRTRRCRLAHCRPASARARSSSASRRCAYSPTTTLSTARRTA